MACQLKQVYGHTIMTKIISNLAGKPAPLSMLIDVPNLIGAYYSRVPDPSLPEQRVSFGTSGHRGSAFDTSFNEWHILAIAQAICIYRKQQKITGPLFIGMDTHALSVPAFNSAIEVLSANGVTLMISLHDEYTPTPVISHAILTYNKGRDKDFADGIVITPSHNPPQDGGIKYNPPDGGPANLKITQWIGQKANELLETQLKEVKRIPLEKALHAPTTHRFDYLNHYIQDLGNIIDMNIIRSASLKLGVDPLGGAGVHYWNPIAEYYNLDLSVVNEVVDPTFRFMTVDWDGQIRMDPSSPYTMVNLLKLKDQFDIAFACDTDHDRHGIVTRKGGLMPPNHYLSVAISYLFQNRSKWNKSKKVGKTIVSSQMIDRVTAKLEHKVYEVPVGFKWFVDGLLDGSLGFCGEESAGATFARIDGNVWTTDKDAIVPALLSAEITAAMGCDLAEIYDELENDLGKTYYKLEEVKATSEQKEILKKSTPELIESTELAGEKIEAILTNAPGNGAAIDGIKVITKGGWFTVRPSGTEEIYKIYAESFHNEHHLNHILSDAERIISRAFNSRAISK